MDDYFMLRDFISVNKLKAEVFETSREVRTAERASEVMGLEADSVAKSIVMVDPNKNPLLVILLGPDHIDFAKIKALLGVRDIRLAEPDEVFEITGYKVGGVPPISIYGIKTLMDRRAANKIEVICGGGDHAHLMRIKVKEILENVEDIEVEDVARHS